jgi:hypothetical protein
MTDIVYYDNIPYDVYAYNEINFNKLHREGDLPAIVFSNGQREWFKYGVRHRENGLPAYIGCLGSKEWYIKGQLHREGDLPAIIWSDSTIILCKHGKKYQKFNLTKLFWLQTCIKILYFILKNKQIWHPNNIAGKYTKNQIYKLLILN